MISRYNRGFRRANRGLSSLIDLRRGKRLLNQLSQSAVLTGMPINVYNLAATLR